MKVNKIEFLVYLSILAVFFISPLNAQDTTKVKEKEQEQKQVKHSPKFVDEDGDGFNDNAPDHDGDGIPNGLDPDYKGQGKKKKFVDLDGDGIDDNIYNEDTEENKKGIGPKTKTTSTQSGEAVKSMKRKRSGHK